jgi:hypothetical protein
MPVYEKVIFALHIPRLTRSPSPSQLFDIPYELGKLDVLVCNAFDAGSFPSLFPHFTSA